jgi:hypothetical protein
MLTRIASAAFITVALTATTASAAPAHQKPTGREVGPPHTVTAYDPTRGCTGDGPVVAQGWCSYYDGAMSGHAGIPVELAATVCRLPGQGAHTLEVDTGEQAEFGASTQDSTVWTWSRGHHFSSYGTTFNLQAGTCLRWHVSWKVVDDSGRPLAPGVYSLMARSLAYPPGSVQIQAYLNEVYFAVT